MNEVKRSQEEVSRSEKYANTVISEAYAEKEKAKRKQSKYNEMITSQEKLIQKKAEELNEQFCKKWRWTMIILIVCFGLATLFTGYKSERVVSDCINAFNTVIGIITIIFNGIIDVSERIEISAGIPKSVLMIIFAIIAFGIIGFIVFFVVRTAIKLYQDYCYDEISLLVALVSIAVFVWFAELMPINIILLLILSNILYVGVRWYIKKDY